MTRKEILEEAIKQVTGRREDDYGKPEDNFRLIASLWTAYLGETVPLNSKDVALMMVLFKVARAAAGTKEDNYVDIAGYAACGGEVDKCTQ